MRHKLAVLCILVFTSLIIASCGKSQDTDLPFPVVSPGPEAPQSGFCKEYLVEWQDSIIAPLVQYSTPSTSYVDVNGFVTWDSNTGGVWVYIQAPDGEDEGYPVPFYNDPLQDKPGWHNAKIEVSGETCVAVVDVKVKVCDPTDAACDPIENLDVAPRFYLIKP